jgi:hypothetical protein
MGEEDVPAMRRRRGGSATSFRSSGTRVSEEVDDTIYITLTSMPQSVNAVGWT